MFAMCLLLTVNQKTNRHDNRYMVSVIDKHYDNHRDNRYMVSVIDKQYDEEML